MYTLWKEDRKHAGLQSSSHSHTKEKLGMVELEDLGKELFRWIPAMNYPGDGRCWAFFADG